MSPVSRSTRREILVHRHSVEKNPTAAPDVPRIDTAGPLTPSRSRPCAGDHVTSTGPSLASPVISSSSRATTASVDLARTTRRSRGLPNRSRLAKPRRSRRDRRITRHGFAAASSTPSNDRSTSGHRPSSAESVSEINRLPQRSNQRALLPVQLALPVPVRAASSQTASATPTSFAPRQPHRRIRMRNKHRRNPILLGASRRAPVPAPAAACPSRRPRGTCRPPP